MIENKLFELRSLYMAPALCSREKALLPQLFLIWWIQKTKKKWKVVFCSILCILCMPLKCRDWIKPLNTVLWSDAWEENMGVRQWCSEHKWTSSITVLQTTKSIQNLAILVYYCFLLSLCPFVSALYVWHWRMSLAWHEQELLNIVWPTRRMAPAILQESVYSEPFLQNKGETHWNQHSYSGLVL